MKCSALRPKFPAGLIASVAVTLPMLLFTACGGGIVAPGSTSQQSTAPTITSVVPDTGPLGGGTVVTINGSNLASGSQQTPPSVTFGGVPATQVIVVSSTQVKAIIPAHTAGIVSVEVTTSAGGSTTLPSAFTYTSTSPTVSSVSPNSGPTAGGTSVTVAGSNFSSGATVSFGGTPASSVSFVSSSQLKATTPAHAAGSVSVVVTNADGTQASLSNAFTYGSSSFAVSSISPISGPAAGGTQVTITGSGFQSGASVTIGGLGATAVTVSNSTTIQAQTPAHSAGSVSVTVTNPDGQSASLSSGFAYHSIGLSWSAPSSSPVAIVGYNVYRSMASGGPFGKLNGSTPVGNTAFTDTTVQGSTTYYYEVKSVDSSGTESAPEGPVQATTPP